MLQWVLVTLVILGLGLGAWAWWDLRQRHQVQASGLMALDQCLRDWEQATCEGLEAIRKDIGVVGLGPPSDPPDKVAAFLRSGSGRALVRHRLATRLAKRKQEAKQA